MKGEERAEEINSYPRNGAAMSCSSELMIFPVTALYLFVSWSSFTRKEQCIEPRTDSKHRYDRGRKPYQGFAP